MIYLDSSILSLQAVLAGAKTTNQLDCTVCFYDVPSQTKTGFQEYRGAIKRTATNDTTDVTICAAPSAGVTRNIKMISIYNKDTVSATVTVKTDDGTTEFIICKRTLLTTETLVINEYGDISIV